MCNHILASGRKCRIVSKKQYCHIHKIDLKLVEISNLNNSIQKKTIKYKAETAELTELIDSMGEEMSRLKKENIRTMSNLQILFDEGKILFEENELLFDEGKILFDKNKILVEENRILKKENEQMKQNNDDYKIIQQYESIKNDLVNKGIDIFSYHNDEFHALRLQRNIIAHKTTQI